MCKIDQGKNVQSLVAISAFVFELSEAKWRAGRPPPPPKQANGAPVNVFQAKCLFVSSKQPSRKNTNQDHYQNHTRQRQRTCLNDDTRYM